MLDDEGFILPSENISAKVLVCGAPVENHALPGFIPRQAHKSLLSSQVGLQSRLGRHLCDLKHMLLELTSNRDQIFK